MEEYLWNSFTQNGKISTFLAYKSYINSHKNKDKLYTNNNTKNNDNIID